MKSGLKKRKQKEDEVNREEKWSGKEKTGSEERGKRSREVKKRWRREEE